MGNVESKVSSLLTWILFGLLILLCLLVGSVLFLEEPPESQGYRHWEKETMRQGGTGERHSKILWLGTALGILQLLFFVSCLAFGVLRQQGFPQGQWWSFLVGGFLYVSVFLLMIFTYWDYVNDPSELFLSLPVPTAVMLLVLWPFPLYFVLFYSLRFDDWVFSKKDLARFHKLASSNRKPPAEN